MWRFERLFESKIKVFISAMKFRLDPWKEMGAPPAILKYCKPPVVVVVS